MSTGGLLGAPLKAGAEAREDAAFRRDFAAKNARDCARVALAL